MPVPGWARFNVHGTAQRVTTYVIAFCCVCARAFPIEAAPSEWRVRSRARVTSPTAMRTAPDAAYVVRCLSLLDQLELTLELLNEWQESEPELPSNVIPFRQRRTS
jgi:hypothetical protein